MDTTLKLYLKSLNNETELEYVYKGYKSEDNINKLKQFLNKILNKGIITKELDISINELFNNNNNIRAVIDNEKDILLFCDKNEDKNYITKFEKKQIIDKSINSDLNFHLNKKNETIIDEDDNDITIFNNYYNISTKFYRYKDRTTYYFPKDDNNNTNYIFKIDITFVKETKSEHLKFSDIQNSPHYEVELEFNNKIDTNNIDTISEDSIKYLKLIYLILTNNQFIIDKKCNINTNFEETKNTKLVEIRQEYNTFCKDINLENIGPKPISINYKDIHNMQDINIENWSVTDKADGERYVLFINKTLEVYLINSHYIIYMTKIDNTDYAYTIIDGELINYIPTKNKINVFENNLEIDFQIDETYYLKYCAFDIYYIGGTINNDIIEDTRRVYKYDLKYRQDKLKELNILLQNNNIEYVNKKYYKLTDYNIIISNYNDINNSDYINYNLDGLILIPNSVIGDANIKSTWYKNLKWKPKKLNTIDFRIKILYIDNNEESNNISIKSTENINIQFYSMNKNVEILFGSGIDPYIHIKNQKISNKCVGTNYLKTLEGNIIHNNDIVECVFDPLNYEWYFIRIRHDKTKPNNYWIANKTWFNLFNTIEIDELINYTKTFNEYNKLLKLSYYNSNERLALSEEDRYRKYNNKVKNELINYCFNIINKDKINVLDLACGRGGDLSKIFNFKNKINLYLGIDIDMNNITNFDLKDQNKNNARARYVQLLTKYISNVDENNIIKKNNVYFICGDLNKINKDNDKLEMFNDSIQNNTYIDDYKDIFKNNKKYDLETLTQINNDNPNMKFNFIQMQFAIHYIDDINTFLLKISQLLENGGIFLFTYLNSQFLDNLDEQKYEDTFQKINKKEDNKLSVKLKTMEKEQTENAIITDNLKNIIINSEFELIYYKDDKNEYEKSNNVFNNIISHNNMLLNKNNSYMILKKK